MTHGMSKKYLMVFLLLLLMGWAMCLRAGMEEADQAKKRLVHIPADHEHQFRFNVNTISGPM